MVCMSDTEWKIPWKIIQVDADGIVIDLSPIGMRQIIMSKIKLTERPDNHIIMSKSEVAVWRR